VSIEDKVYRLLEKKVEPFRLKLDRREREGDRLKTSSEVFDESTMMTLYALLNREVLGGVEGNLSSGKEANIFLATDSRGEYVAIKIYRIHTTSFRRFTPYIDGDPRFKRIPKDHRALVFIWAKKEYKNLQRLRSAGLSVPRPLFHLNNVLVMEYVGTDEEPARPLKEEGTGDPAGELAWALDAVETMATKARLVHSDFSEYNILRHPGSGEKVIIDVAQSVVLDHPSSFEFLVRDISNITRYFVRAGAEDGPDPREAAMAIFGKTETEKQDRRAKK
jgi:RIO kinase 1